MKDINNLNIDELKEWFGSVTREELNTLDTQTSAYLLETLTPYKDKMFYNNAMRFKLITQWLEHEETWEEYPVSRKKMFEGYREINGSLPEVTVSTLSLFNYFIGIGRVNQLTTA